MSIEIIIGIATLVILVFQLWILRRQTKIINSQKEISETEMKYKIRKEGAEIDLQKYEYVDDKIKLNLINMGKTKAMGVALKTEAILIQPKLKKENNQIWASTRGSWNVEKQFNLVEDNNKYALKATITDIFHKRSNYPELEINQGTEFLQDVKFGLYDGKMSRSIPTKCVTFKQLLNILRENNVLGCQIKIGIVYKNLMNSIVDEINVDHFYIMPPMIKPKQISELKENEKIRKGGMDLV